MDELEAHDMHLPLHSLVSRDDFLRFIVSDDSLGATCEHLLGRMFAVAQDDSIELRPMMRVSELMMAAKVVNVITGVGDGPGPSRPPARRRAHVEAKILGRIPATESTSTSEQRRFI